MPIRSSGLVALAHELRHARTRLMPIETAERVQHTIVRIEQMLASSVIEPGAADAIASEARSLLDECETFLKP